MERSGGQDQNTILQQLREDFRQFCHLPQELFIYAENVLRQNNESDDFVQCLLADNRLNTLRYLDGWFQRACDTVGILPRLLARDMDFSPADTNRGRLESFLAQVRAIPVLRSFGASEIKPLSSRGKVEADFVASFGNVKCAVEVFHRAPWSHLAIGHAQKSYNFVDFFTNRATDKKRQLDATASTHSCKKMLLLGIFDSSQLVALKTRTSFELAVEQAATALDWGSNYHFAISTGLVSYEGEDDCIYPPLGVVKG